MPSAASARASEYEKLLTRVNAVLAEAHQSVGLIVLSFDELAEIRARVGFAAAEKLVADLSSAFAAAVRDKDEVAQIGDATFAMLMPGLKNKGHASLAAEKLQRVANDVIAQSGASLRPGIHLGVSIYPQQAQTAADLVHRAQVAQSSARRSGMCVQMFEDSCVQRVHRDWELERRFADSLDAGEIEMHYQPKVRISDGKPAGAEALMRWIHQGRVVASPDVFIPLSEAAGLVLPTTLYALNSAARQAALWPDRDPPLTVAVNLSPGMFAQRDFLEIVRGALSTWNLSPGRLTLEITEGALVKDFAHAARLLNALRDDGIRISIDDFGTGYSSLSYFRKIPADELKIDKSFVQRMLQDDDDASIVRTIIGLARRFRLSIVAEGIEDERTLAALAEMGCDYAQGYLYAAALDHEGFMSWLAAHAPSNDLTATAAAFA
jgi:diguanylate cyclase (GGDEF)-like protein